MDPWSKGSSAGGVDRAIPILTSLAAENGGGDVDEAEIALSGVMALSTGRCAGSARRMTFVPSLFNAFSNPAVLALVVAFSSSGQTSALVRPHAADLAILSADLDHESPRECFDDFERLFANEFECECEWECECE